MDGIVKQVMSQSTLINSTDWAKNKDDINIITLSECWTCEKCLTGGSNAPNHELTRVEKLAALVVLLQSQWTHFSLEYLERITYSDPELFCCTSRPNPSR